MSRAEPDFTIGIEEEYLLVDRESLALARAPDAMMQACAATLEGQFSPEFLECQIEIWNQSLCWRQRGTRRAEVFAEHCRAYCSRAWPRPNRRLVPPIFRLERPASHQKRSLQRTS